MVKIFDEYEGWLDGGSFSSHRKNLGNKLFIYAACRIMADILDYDLDVPDTALIKRMDKVELFPFKGITGRTRYENYNDYLWVHDPMVATMGSLEEIANLAKGKMLYTNASFTAYPLIKPYESKVREMYSSLVKDKRPDADEVFVMLRDSNYNRGFYLPYSYYFDILEKNNWNKVVLGADHPEKHEFFTNELNKRGYSVTILNELGPSDLFKEITSFNNIISSQGSFSFFAAWLSNATKIYWPITNDGPNSYHLKPQGYYDVNFKVEGDDRYNFVNVNLNERI